MILPEKIKKIIVLYSIVSGMIGIIIAGLSALLYNDIWKSLFYYVFSIFNFVYVYYYIKKGGDL